SNSVALISIRSKWNVLVIECPLMTQSGHERWSGGINFQGSLRRFPQAAGSLMPIHSRHCSDNTLQMER
ncbi:hypothetical protein, partial [Bradyrhizobium sp.]|uniref:hypothetical protein n=1 Tax=Bradyrhizobium sp. TaxID=376 RepID=UPI003C716AB9